MRIQLLFPVLLIALLPLAASRPQGAGGCQRNGFGSVDGSHLTQAQITTGKLEDFGLTVVVSETTFDEGETLVEGSTFELKAGVDYNVYLDSSNGESYKGFLFRLESQDGVDTTAALSTVTDDALAQVAQNVCVQNEDVGGVTHTNNDPKMRSTAVMRMDEASSGMIFSVTAVIHNHDDESDYYFTEYTLNAVGGTSGGGTSAAVTRACSIGWSLSALVVAACFLV